MSSETNRRKSAVDATVEKHAVAASPPPVPAWFQGGFHTFLGSYLRRHFHSIALHREGWQPSSLDANSQGSAGPLIVYANHPSWWDPLIGHYVNLQLFKPRQFYAPIDAIALEKYRVFAKLGFYGVDLSSHSGAAAFLQSSLTILNHPRTSLWITPEGRFCDARDDTAALMPGLPHLCTKLTSGAVVPMALEYLFWEERLPECLIRFGEPLRPSEHTGVSKQNWAHLLTDSLRKTQRQLAADCIGRDASKFAPVLRGRSGAGGLYDVMRAIKSRATGKRFRPEHGDKLQ